MVVVVVVWVVGCGLYLYFYTSLARLLWQPSKDSAGWREMTRISDRTGSRAKPARSAAQIGFHSGERLGLGLAPAHFDKL